MYSREHGGAVLTFGVSGKLWKNALVMYDRETGTLWSHLTGKALVGPLAGEELDVLVSVPKMKWKDWKAQHPDTKVLSVNGAEDLRHDTYRDYHRSSRTGLFSPGHTDRRLSRKDMVIGVTVDGRQKAYPLDKKYWNGRKKGELKLIQDSIGEMPVLVYHNPETYATAVYDRRREDGSERTFPDHATGFIVTDTNGEKWNLLTGEGPDGKMLKPVPHVNIYWFAWADFYPETRVYSKNGETD